MTVPQETLIPRAELKRRYSKSHVTVWRWEKRPDFPAPAAIISGRRYYRLSDLEKWESLSQQIGDK